MSFRAAILLTACLVWPNCAKMDYCKSCPDHPTCSAPNVSKDCLKSGEFGVTEVEKKEIVDTHNKYRRIVASGKESRGNPGPQPRAANLMKLSWDEELANVAQLWADGCRPERDHCYKNARWKVDQLLYFQWGETPHKGNWTQAISHWYSYVLGFNSQRVKSYWPIAGHNYYPVLMWHSTYAVGCGRRASSRTHIYVCYYGPKGRVKGEPIYTVGDPCSQCPKDTVCQEFLCAKKT